MQINTDLKAAYLRCEYKVDPLGIDVIKPRLSWIIESISANEHSQFQAAYRIIVSSSIENLYKDIPDYWDSGKVYSDQQNQVEYVGKKLQSKNGCWWKVKIWDKDNRETEWSLPAKWTMGLLNKNDWKAKWIGYDKWEREEAAKKKFEFKPGVDNWIWFPLSKTGDNNGIGNYFFRKNIFIKNLNGIVSAKILITADERFILYINGKLIDQCDDKIFSWTRPKLIEIKSHLTEGKNLIAVEGINTYLDKPGLSAKIILVYSDGHEELIKTDNDWKTSDIKNANWLDSVTDESKWINAEITAAMGGKPWRIPKVDLFLPPPAYLRKEFSTNKEIKKAFAFISALGLYKVFINGNEISNDRLTPGCTDYKKRVHYNTYDVKDHLSYRENNCVGIILADGWYAGYIGWEKQREYYGKNPRAILQLEIEYDDGITEIICSDKNWKASYGPIVEADILMGETYDARKELSGWNKINYDSSNWQDADITNEVNVEVNSYPGIPIRKTLEIKPTKISSPGKGIYIFDLGQNIAGCVRLKIDGKKSGKVILRFGEMLDAKGNLYTENIRMARAADTYYTKGEQEEIWEPHFTYHGFRYVEVTGLNEEPETEMITGIVFHSDLPVTGSFECSNIKLNKLYHNIFWSQRANFMDIPTDCPQRDERFGWTADAIDFINTASFNMDVSAFYSKWLQDLNDAQEGNGAYTAIAPLPDLGVGPLYPGAAGWADAGIITPYTLYNFYGDKNILNKHYHNMIRYMDYLEKESKEYICPDYGYGDWLSINADTPKDLIATAFFAYDAELMKDISAILSKEKEEKRFKELFQNIKKSFNEKYVNPDGSIKSGTQTAYLLALHFKLLDEETEQKAFQFLIEDIVKRGYHSSTGFVGLTYLFPVLTKFNRGDIVYKLLLNETFPSWINMIDNGATTMWERWDSWSPDQGIYDPLMNSFNHTSLGVIGEWFYSGIGGIIAEEPGFKKIIIKPQFGGGLNYARVSYNSINGKIISEWRIVDNYFYLKINLPVNTSAKVILPKNINELSLNNLRSKPGKEIYSEDQFFVINISSGENIFDSSLVKNI